VPETVSLAVRTAASMSKGTGEAEEEASGRVAAYEFQSARRDGCDSLAVAVEAAVPPVNQACAVLFIAAAAEVEEEAAGGDSTARMRRGRGCGWREVENDGSPLSRLILLCEGFCPFTARYTVHPSHTEASKRRNPTAKVRPNEVDQLNSKCLVYKGSQKLVDTGRFFKKMKKISLI
jgi:hypothetical protein